MNALHKTAAAMATVSLLLPGTALAGHGHGKSAHAGKQGAPGQVCKSLKVKGKKTPEQRAAYQKCIHDAAAAQDANTAGDDDVTNNDAPPAVPVTPAPVA